MAFIEGCVAFILTSGVAFIEGCPDVRGGLYEGFHCNFGSVLFKL